MLLSTFKHPEYRLYELDEILKEFFKPYYDTFLIALDSYTLYTKKVNILVIDDIDGKYVLNKIISD